MLRFFILVSLLMGTAHQRLHACRYTVRDIGFVPIYGAEFSLVLQYGSSAASEQHSSQHSHQQPNAPAEWMSALKSLLAGSNISPMAARVDSEVDSLPAPLDRVDFGQSPLHVRLVDRNGRSLNLTSSFSQLNSTEQLEEWSNEILFTPLIRSLCRQSSQTFAQLLIIEGPDKEDNAHAHQIADQALAALEKIEPLLPRPIAFPSRKVVVPSMQSPTEKLLLWSLGIDLDPPTSALAVIYGRGRLAGAVMLGDSITLRETLSQLALVGESCECETDRAWMDEPSIIFQWNREDRQRSANLLGFDPDSPLVRAEMLRIVSQGKKSGRQDMNAGSPNAGSNRTFSSDGATAKRPDAIERLLMGYSESELAASTVPNQDINNKSVTGQQETTLQETALRETIVDAPSGLRAQVIVGGGWDFDKPEASRQFEPIGSENENSENESTVQSISEGDAAPEWLGEVSIAVIISLLLVVGGCSLGGLFFLSRG